MQLEITLLSLFVLIIVLLIIFRNTPFVKKYWKYSLILIPGIIILILKILLVIRGKNIDTGSSQDTPVKEHITNIKDSLQEVNTTTKIEAAIAKEKNDEKINELKEVQKIEDARERRKRLAEMAAGC